MAIGVLQQVITKLFLNFAKKKLCRLLSVIPIVYATLGVNNSWEVQQYEKQWNINRRLFKSTI